MKAIAVESSKQRLTSAAPRMISQNGHDRGAPGALDDTLLGMAANLGPGPASVKAGGDRVGRHLGYVTPPLPRPMPPAPPSVAPPLPPARRRVFLAATLALPWLLLALLEVGLRLGGYGGGYPLFVPYAEQPGWLMPNPEFAKRYFQSGAFTPTPHVDFFRADKAPSTFRVVFQGESSAAGFPYGHGGAPSRMLQQRLQATFPGRPIEVVNVAFTAINSYTLLDQAGEVLAQRPDAVLIYTGHNEYYGAFGAASAGALGRSRPLVRTYLALRRLRTVQLLGNLLGAGAATLGGAPGAGDAEAPRTVMQLMAGDQLVPLGSAKYAQGLAQFRGNLADLLARYQAAGVPVFVGTVASNERDQPPFVSLPAAPGDTSAADHFARARAADARGDTAAARAHYRAAKEHDALRFRAPEAVNAILREEAARHGATVVETERAIARASPLGVPGRTLILEHLHPNLDGYFLVADAFYEALRARGLPASYAPPNGAPVPAAAARAVVPVTPVDSLAALYRTGRLTSGWPFQPRNVAVIPPVDTLRPRTPAERFAQALVLGTTSWAEATDGFRLAAEQAGDAAGATRAALALAAEFPYTPRPYMDAARLAVVGRHYDEALGYARLALARREAPESAELVGLLMLRAGDQAGALPYLERAAVLAPSDRRMTTSLTAARALPAFEAQRASTPRDTVVLYRLALSYALTNQYDKAREALAALRAVAPAHAGARALAARLPPS